MVSTARWLLNGDSGERMRKQGPQQRIPQTEVDRLGKEYICSCSLESLLVSNRVVWLLIIIVYLVNTNTITISYNYKQTSNLSN
jgi:hypothetical protein